MPAIVPATIAGLAKASGIDVESIRFYQRLGLLAKPRRGVGGGAAYHREHLERLTFIRRALEFGFSLDTVGELIGLSGGLRTRSDLYTIAERHLADIRRQNGKLSRIESSLAAVIAGCPKKGLAKDCPLILELSRTD
ncbi:MAG: MerR family transcriptional regulator [Reyranellales bacterium]